MRSCTMSHALVYSFRRKWHTRFRLLTGDLVLVVSIVNRFRTGISTVNRRSRTGVSTVNRRSRTGVSTVNRRSRTGVS